LRLFRSSRSRSRSRPPRRKTIAEHEAELDELNGKYADFLNTWEERVAEEIARLDDLSARGLGGGFEARLTRIEAAVTSRLGVDLGADPRERSRTPRRLRDRYG
jgi:hypothetical protein